MNIKTTTTISISISEDLFVQSEKLAAELNAAYQDESQAEELQVYRLNRFPESWS